MRCIAPARLSARIDDLAALLAGAGWPVEQRVVARVGAGPAAAVRADDVAAGRPDETGGHAGLALPAEVRVVDLFPAGGAEHVQRGSAERAGAGEGVGFAAPNLLAQLSWPAAALRVLAGFPLAEAGGCDVVALPPVDRPALLIVSDVDSTLIAEEVIEELAEAAGTREEVARITEAAMRGELDFAASLAQRVRTLAGVPEGIFAEVAARITPRPFAVELVGALHERSGRFGAVSGGFMEVLTPLGKQLNLDYWAANTLEVADAQLTGRTVGAVVDRAAKSRILGQWLEDAGLSSSVAMGDGANDLDMFAAADLSIALCAKPAARAGANVVLTMPHLAAVAATLWR
ncbi:MAG: phosphoserine phosphatase SerB [Buchananella hordeovulneris]|nr:phosphoserine phosphatase SerB [Buchananella hordeovulneris]